MSQKGRSRGRHGHTSYSRYFHEQVRYVLSRHIQKRERGFRTITRLLMDFEPSGTVADEAYDVLSREAIRDFCQKGRFLPDPLIDLICDYLREEEPQLATSFNEAEFRESVGESLVQFFGTRMSTPVIPDIDAELFGTPGLYINCPGYECDNRSREEWISSRDSNIIEVLVIQYLEEQRVRLAAEIPLDNPLKTNVGDRGARFIPKAGYSVKTSHGAVLMLRRQSDHGPVFEFQRGEPDEYVFQTKVMRHPNRLDELNDRDYSTWVRADDDMSIYRQFAEPVYDRLQRMTWR